MKVQSPFNMEMSSYQYRDTIIWLDETVVRLSYLYNGNPYISDGFYIF